MSDIRVESLTHVYAQGTPFEKIALDHINLEIPSGQCVGIIGHTGSGKSTFIQHLNGLLKPTEGRVLLDGTDIFSGKEITRAARFRVGLVFQYPEYQLFEETVYKDISFGPKNMKLTRDEIDARVREAAAFVGIAEEIFEKSPLELSGGQKRRVAIAGVIAMRPEVLVLDEPTAGLDPAGRESIVENILSYREATGATVILVTHDMDQIAEIAGRIIVFNNAEIAMDGTPERVFTRAGELESMGLAIPGAAKIALRLREKGIQIPDSVYTTEQLKEAVLRLYNSGEQGGGGKC